MGKKIKAVMLIILIILFILTLVLLERMRTVQTDVPPSVLPKIKETQSIQKNTAQINMVEIIRVVKIERKDFNFTGMEVHLLVEGDEKTEVFDDFDYWMERVNGEERFITRIKENHQKTALQIQTAIDNDQTAISITKTEITKFNNQEI